MNLNIMNSAIKNFDFLATSSSVLHNHFDGLTNLFLDLVVDLIIW